MKILSNWIASDQKFLSKNLHKFDRWIYKSHDHAAVCVLHNDKFAWLDNETVHMNPQSTVLNGLLLCSVRPKNNWTQNELVEHIGYVDLNSCSRDLVVLHTLVGSYTSCRVLTSSSNTVTFNWSEDQLPNLVMNLKTRQLTSHRK